MNKKHLYMIAAAAVVWWMFKRGAFAMPKALPAYPAPKTPAERAAQQADFAARTEFAP
jgi:hypothetical protein